MLFVIYHLITSCECPATFNYVFDGYETGVNGLGDLIFSMGRSLTLRYARTVDSRIEKIGLWRDDCQYEDHLGRKQTLAWVFCVKLL